MGGVKNDVTLIRAPFITPKSSSWDPLLAMRPININNRLSPTVTGTKSSKSSLSINASQRKAGKEVSMTSLEAQWGGCHPQNPPWLRHWICLLVKSVLYGNYLSSSDMSVTRILARKGQNSKCRPMRYRIAKAKATRG